ncbi:MAG: hypothetical protein ACIALR_17590 [Blastopirellula sp. JB062]
MKRTLIILMVLLANASSVIGEDAWIGPTHGVLLLKNGNTLAGAITVSGDAYVVALNEDAVIRVPAKGVERRCANLAEAHQYRCGQVKLDTIAGRLKIAQWCMRAELFSEADVHLQWVERSDPQNEMGQLARRRLDSLVKQPEIAMTSAVQETSPADAPGVISDKELEEFTKKFHPQAAGQFATIIQPILLNACSASACHGPNAESDFRLIPSGHGLMPRRLTLRNMLTTYNVAQIDRNGAIPLLEALYDNHGGKINTKTNAWPRQVAALRSWAMSVQPRGEKPRPIRQAGFQGPVETGSPPAKMSPIFDKVRIVPQTSSPESEPQSEYQSKDPFDPEIFNRRQADR